jgi:Ca2+-binding RTX toxin-like protein
LTNQAVTDAIGNTQTFTLYASGASTTDQIIQLALQSGSGNQYVCTGANTISFANGPVNITIPAGQDSVTVTLIDASNTSSAETLNLTASITDASGTVTSNQLAVTFDQPGVGTTTGAASYTYDSNFDPMNFGTTASPQYQYDSAGNLIENPNSPDSNRIDSIAGTSGNDLLITSNAQSNVVTATQGGNDTIRGGTGSNNINLGNGSNLVVGNGGQDVIISGNGSNQIYANTQADLATALANRTTGTASGLQGDLIAVGNGNNTIVGGNGNDNVFTGTGQNTIVLGNGNNTVSGGVEVIGANLNWTTTQSYTLPYLENHTGITGASAPFSAPANYAGNYFGSNPVGLGSDTIFGGSGNSIYWLSNGDCGRVAAQQRGTHRRTPCGCNWLDAGGGNCINLELIKRCRYEAANDAKERVAA